MIPPSTTTAPEALRCFLGMRLDKKAHAQLLALQEQLQRLPKSAARRIKLVPEGSFHLTLKFLGQTTHEQRDAAVASLTKVAAESNLGTAEMTGLGAFPTAAQPHTIFVGVRDASAALTALARAIDVALLPLGFAVDDKPYSPHVTLARIVGAARHGPLTAWINSTPERVLGHVRTEALVLFESIATPVGSRYRALAEMPTAGT